MTTGRFAFAVLGLAASFAACRPAGPPPAPREPIGMPTAEPHMRIGVVVEQDRVAVAASTAAEIVGAAGTVLAPMAAGETWTFSATAAGRVRGEGSGSRRIDGAEGLVLIRPAPGGSVRIGEASYRGEAAIRATETGRVSAINVVALEEYLLGVVPAEIPSTQPEAVKAQAVAARTYAIAHIGQYPRLGFDVYATTADQVYGGVAREDPVATRAVKETRGEILVYDGSPIAAYYHSTCGGRTAAIEEAWGGPPVPYLRSVSDEIPGTDRAYCDISNRYRWTVRWTGDELSAMLSRALGALGLGGATTGTVRRVERLEVAGRTPSGRAEELLIQADGQRHVVRRDSIRQVLRPEPDRLLNSTFFVLDVRREGGTVREAEARGGGWGHGVGMCQMGAIGRARDGQSYREILQAYYRGATIARLY